jgi:3,4-dihydroxy-2-butanone 4-phosphate synthase
MKEGPGSKPCPVSCNIYVDKYKMKKLQTLLHFGKSTNVKLVIHNLTCRLAVNTLALHL